MTKPTVFLLGLAHLPTINETPTVACAYSMKQLRLSDMLTNLGYKTVFLGVEGTQVHADETVICLSEHDRNRLYGPLESYTSRFFNHGRDDEAYKIFRKNAIKEILDRVQPGDILSNPMGNYYEELCRPESHGGVEKAVGFPFLAETGIGYTGILENTHRVFETNSWRAYCYGMYNAWTQGRLFGNVDFYDDVIGNSYYPDHYKFNANKEDFYLMNCRIATRKGIQIAIQTVQETEDKLIICGQSGEPVNMDFPNVQYIGFVSESEKVDLLSHAKGVFSPTTYWGPFEGICVEAQMSGTPVITTDAACYYETVVQSVTGFRCNTLKEFVHAARHIDEISPAACRDWAVSQFSTDVCGKKYDRYFGRLGDLWKKGWGELG